MIRLPVPADTPALIALADETGLFQPGESSSLLGGVLDAFHAGQLGAGHLAWVWADGPGAAPAGWVYFAPTEKADGVWDLWWIGVAPARQGEGIGGDLLRSVEAHARTAGGRLLVVETSSQPALEPTRRFYVRQGYTECGLVPDFYADGDGKLIYAKRIDGATIGLLERTPSES